MTVGAIFIFFAIPLSVLAMAWTVAAHYERKAELEAMRLKILERAAATRAADEG